MPSSGTAVDLPGQSPRPRSPPTRPRSEGISALTFADGHPWLLPLPRQFARAEMGRRWRRVHCVLSHTLDRLSLIRRARCPSRRQSRRHCVWRRLALHPRRRGSAEPKTPFEDASRREADFSHHQRPVTPHPSPPDLSQSPLQAVASLQAEPNRGSRRSHHPSPSPDIRHRRLNVRVGMCRATRHPKGNRRDKRLETQERGLEDWLQLGTADTPSPHPAGHARFARCGLTSHHSPHEAALDTLGRVRFRATHRPYSGRLHESSDQSFPPASLIP